ncbi:MAG: YHYH domain-containing protein [Rubrivivax sp.]|nr:MAG: YHYH domain-containing protein [Rubrivivax sp.]
MKKLFAAMAVLFAVGSAMAHGGGLDKSGCHHNRKTGDYHCHR